MQQEGKKRGQVRGECIRGLKSLVAYPLNWLLRDQQGAKSTQGGRK